jgi:hypothetical protein
MRNLSMFPIQVTDKNEIKVLLVPGSHLLSVIQDEINCTTKKCRCCYFSKLENTCKSLHLGILN